MSLKHTNISDEDWELVRGLPIESSELVKVTVGDHGDIELVLHYTKPVIEGIRASTTVIDEARIVGISVVPETHALGYLEFIDNERNFEESMKQRIRDGLYWWDTGEKEEGK